MDPVTVAKLWLLIRPWRRFKIWRGKRKLAKTAWATHHLDEVAEEFNTEIGMKTWLQSRTIQGLLASGVALVLGLFVSDADTSGLATQITQWLLDGIQIGGLVYAAHGRKNAQGPIT